MSTTDEGHGRKPSPPTRIDSGFTPRPVKPDEARRRGATEAERQAREIVELTSPIGHRLRVAPPAAPNALALDPPPAAGTKPKR